MSHNKWTVFILVTISIFSLSLSANATYIQDSSYDQRHQKMLYESALESCKVLGGKAVQISSKEEAVHIDNGIVDYIYDTVIELTVQIDQGVRDVYVVDIQSRQSDHYDHNDQDWGAYSIEYSTCYQEQSRTQLQK
jgi:hypothetical protein